MTRTGLDRQHWKMLEVAIAESQDHGDVTPIAWMASLAKDLGNIMESTTDTLSVLLNEDTQKMLLDKLGSSQSPFASII